MKYNFVLKKGLTKINIVNANILPDIGGKPNSENTKIMNLMWPKELFLNRLFY